MEDKNMNRLKGAGNVRKISLALYVVCALLLLADLFLHKHTHISAEQWFGFYGLYALLVCVVLVLAARGLRAILGRKEDYYD